MTVACLPAAAADLTLHRVMLSAAGVGYFEYGAHVDGASALGLDVPLEQVDDVLRSLAVYDDHGGVGSIELPGRDDLRQAFSDVPFSVDTLGSPAALLDSLRGEEISVSGPSAMTGKIVGTAVESQVAPPGAAGVPANHTRVTLLTADGLRQFILEDATAVRLTDAGLRARVGAALDAARQQSAATSRHLTLRATGTGARNVTVGYVAAAPLWKASYRVVLPNAGADHARVQGWAVLENQSGADWKGVDLTLQSGNPVTFHQAIYASYYANRPEVPVEVLGQLLPDADTRSAGLDSPFQVPSESVRVRAQRRLSNPLMPMAKGPRMPAEAAAPPPASAMSPAQEYEAEPAGLAVPENSASAQPTIIDTSFHIATPVDLARGHTASVPIIDREIPAEQIDWLQAYSSRPVTALRLTNDGAASLPAGVLTLYTAATKDSGTEFAGDARLSGLPSGEKRLLGFAEDLATHAERSASRGPDTLVSVKFADGVLTESLRHRDIMSVKLSAPVHDARKVLVEFPKQAGAHFSVKSGGDSGVEETDTAWRVLVSLQAGETRTLQAYADTPVSTDMTLMPDNGEFDDEALASVLAQGTLDGAAREKFQQLADLRGVEAAKRAVVKRLTDEQVSVTQDEDRVRRNLQAVVMPGNFHDKLLDALEVDEARLNELRHEIGRAQADLDQAHGAVVAAVRKLVI
jgi:hypothetical protein